MIRRLPPEPQVGDRITAELIRELIRCIRERQLLKGPNYSLSTGPNGTWLKIDPPKAGSAGPVDNGCWKIVTETTGSGTSAEVVHRFDNQFYLDGERLVELDLDDTLEEFIDEDSEPSSGEEYGPNDKPYVCLKIPATTTSTAQPAVIGYESVSEMQEAQRDTEYVIKPLYKITRSCGIKIDFRNCPAFQLAEEV